MSLPGSKPKKQIKRVNYQHPTFTSYDVTSMFNPQIYGDRDYYRKLYSTKQKDSLQKAQKEYEAQRSKSVVQEHIPKGQVDPKITNDNSQVNQLNQHLNFFDQRSIKNKQLHGYNILSNM